MVPIDNTFIGNFINLDLAIGGLFHRVASGQLETVFRLEMVFTQVLSWHVWFKETFTKQFEARTSMI